VGVTHWQSLEMRVAKVRRVFHGFEALSFFKVALPVLIQLQTERVISLSGLI